jgi:hypothetical protein
MEYTSHYLLQDFDILGKAPEPFNNALFGIEFGVNTSDMVINGARIAKVPVGVRLGKIFTDPQPPQVNQYAAIDVAFEQVALPYEDLDPEFDLILDGGDLVPDRFVVELNGGAPMVYLSPATTWGTRLDFTGSKTDSIGPSPVPAGTDQLGIDAQDMIALCEQHGYQRSGNGDPYVVVPAYFTARATGQIEKLGLVVQLGPQVEALLGNPFHAWRDAVERGPIDLASQPPVAVDDSAATAIDTEVAIAVLDNDADPDGDPLRVDGVVPPNHGLVFTRADGALVYRPDPGFTGSDRFGYWASDDQGNFSRATVQVAVSGDILFADGFER